MQDFTQIPIDAQTLLVTCPLPMLLLDSEGRIVAHNPALLEFSGVDASQFLGKTADQLPAGLQGLLAESALSQWQDTQGQLRQIQTQRAMLDGGYQVCWLQDRTEIQQLMAQRDRLQEELRAHALTDERTGLLNQRGVMLALEPQVARNRRYNGAMSVIMMEACTDSDSEEVQREVSHLLKDQLRWADIIGYTEQKEFIMVLPETNREDAMKLADKLSARLHELRGATDSIWHCYGVTEWQKNDNAAALLRRAGAALAQSRSEHKGRAVAL